MKQRKDQRKGKDRRKGRVDHQILAIVNPSEDRQFSKVLIIDDLWLNQRDMLVEKTTAADQEFLLCIKVDLMISSFLATIYGVFLPISPPSSAEHCSSDSRALKPRVFSALSLYVLSPALIFETLEKASITSNEVTVTVAFCFVECDRAMGAECHGRQNAGLVPDREIGARLDHYFTNSVNYGFRPACLRASRADKASVYVIVQIIIMNTLGVYLAARSHFRPQRRSNRCLRSLGLRGGIRRALPVDGLPASGRVEYRRYHAVRGLCAARSSHTGSPDGRGSGWRSFCRLQARILVGHGDANAGGPIGGLGIARDFIH